MTQRTETNERQEFITFFFYALVTLTLLSTGAYILLPFDDALWFLMSRALVASLFLFLFCLIFLPFDFDFEF